MSRHSCVSEKSLTIPPSSAPGVTLDAAFTSEFPIPNLTSYHNEGFTECDRVALERRAVNATSWPSR